MKYYCLAWLALLFSLFMYLLGSKDQMEDVVKGCNSKNEFVVDGVSFVCISKEEYFK